MFVVAVWRERFLAEIRASLTPVLIVYAHIYCANGLPMLQGASQAAIEFLGASPAPDERNRGSRGS